MIIKIINDMNLDTDSEIKIAAIENLLRAHGEGKHHIWMPIPAVKSLLRAEGFGSYSKRVLNEMVSQANEQRQIHKDFLFYANVDFKDKHRLDFVGDVWHIGYSHFSDSASTQESILLTENDLDGEAFLWGAKTYLHKQKISGLGVTLEIQPGGGNTTINSFLRLDKSKRFFACIIDSDKGHPKAKLGTTAKRFKRISKGFEDKRYFEILQHHEIENLLPFSILRAVAGDTCNEGIVFDPDFASYRVYPDHKLGLTVRQAAMDDREQKDKYWDRFSERDGDEMICPQFGDEILKRCVEYMGGLSPKKAVGYVDDTTDVEWLRISKLVASWGVGGRILRS